MSNNKEAKLKAFGELLDVLDILRIQCPWDAKQTNESLRPNTIEETMELCDALIKNNVSEIKKELGDVLLHILFYAKIADEKQQFDIADVCDALRNKLIFRHPHIFGDTKVDNAEQVLQNWEALKLKEKGGNKTVLSGVPKSLPSVIKAERIQEKSANVGFDWDKPEDVWDKVKEEIAEVETELKAGNRDNMEKEFGDLLFSVINAARLYGVRADNALELTNNKFITRFNHIEQRALDMGKKINELSLAEMDALWNEAKNLPI
ncbi:MAG: nucleoside triphosphate pyrophosphohydrolase [Muribaculaceae bacterium]|nr:nucleoside triphosphate pyrophosphohydrolase [Muribaculaceae bacterium]MDD6019269.1 nucleoside triphosphate pyrophosphohydrolase [bacterium]MDD6027147.1 nucleoside triphosphate pyrophosphohydrolase [bacterium]